MVLGGCARQGSNPQDPTGTVPVVVSGTAVASAAVIQRPGPASAVPVPVAPRPGEASCAWGATPRFSLDPSASYDASDPEQRMRRALAEQNPPTPRRGSVPDTAVPGAEACVHALQLKFNLLARASGTPPDEEAIGAALRSAGLTKIVVRPGPAFAASTGAACVRGTFTASGPAFSITPLDGCG